MSISKRVRFEIFKRDRFTCQYCGKRPPEVTLEADHVLAIAEGGDDAPDNLTTSCSDCNRGKGAKNLGETAPAVDEMDLLAAMQEMSERRASLRARAEAASQLWAAEDDSIAALRVEWYKHVHETTPFQETTMRRFIRRLSFDEIIEAMEVVDEKWSHLGSWVPLEAWRYFCGVCWNKVSDHERTS